MQIDYHTHHVRCGHAEGTLEQYIQSAIDQGLQQIGLSDHMPLLHVNLDTYLPGSAMLMEELPRYVEECLMLKEKYKGDIDVRIGLEGDYIEGYEAQIKAIIDAYPWDYVIGSVHFLGQWDITDHRQLAGWEGKDRYAVYEQYYDAIAKAARTGMYDFIGHFDVIKRFGFHPEQDVIPLEDAALAVIQNEGLAIELNASGLRTPAKEMFPSRRIIERCYELGIPVTLGSDAHQPQRVAQYLPEARQLLYDIGFRQLATFTQRKRVMIDFGKAP